MFPKVLTASNVRTVCYCIACQSFYVCFQKQNTQITTKIGRLGFSQRKCRRLSHFTTSIVCVFLCFPYFNIQVFVKLPALFLLFPPVTFCTLNIMQLIEVFSYHYIINWRAKLVVIFDFFLKCLVWRRMSRLPTQIHRPIQNGKNKNETIQIEKKTAACHKFRKRQSQRVANCGFNPLLANPYLRDVTRS